MKTAGHYEGCLEIMASLGTTRVCYCQSHEVVKQEEARHLDCNENLDRLQRRLDEACHLIDSLESLILPTLENTEVEPGSVIGRVLEELAVFRG